VRERVVKVEVRSREQAQDEVTSRRSTRAKRSTKQLSQDGSGDETSKANGPRRMFLVDLL
jgi:hypothetical protein